MDGAHVAGSGKIVTLERSSQISITYLSSNKVTKNASAASCNAFRATLWNLRWPLGTTWNCNDDAAHCIPPRSQYTPCHTPPGQPWRRGGLVSGGWSPAGTSLSP